MEGLEIGYLWVELKKIRNWIFRKLFFRNVLRQRWNTEAGEKMGIKTKLKELAQEKEHLQKRLKEREAGFLEIRNALGKELKEVREEGNSWRRKVEGMEGKVTAWKLEKSSLENQLR